MEDFVSNDVETAAVLAADDRFDPRPVESGDYSDERPRGKPPAPIPGCRNQACSLFGWRMFTTHCHECRTRLRPTRTLADVAWMRARGLAS